MSKNILIDAAHSEETRVALIDNGKLDRFDFDTVLKNQIKGNIYLAKVIRVEPSLQAAFMDYGGNRHGFLSFSEIHHDYFQIPISDRNDLEAHLQNAIENLSKEKGISAEEIDPRDLAKLRYQFYRRYKIQEVIKKRQIMLIQVTKEERGNKGAAITTYISLAGRYCVLMPNTDKSSGVSRKIINKNDRTKLKDIVNKLPVEQGSVVIRTAGVGHTKAEITKDFNYLNSLWNEIRATVLKSTAPCLIHEEANIIKRSIRDLYSKDVDSIVVEGRAGYDVARSYVKRLMPSHVKKVKLYEDTSAPLFGKYGISDQISQIYSTRVNLPSGGYLIINNTEALVAIDVNSGKATRERNISGTALKTNLEAAAEIARQCRLRDLAGLVVVDFIDMEERSHNVQVERAMKEALRSDKAKILVGSISEFGLLEFSRQRLRSSIADANMVVCPHCRGTGFMWTHESMAVQVLRRIEDACSTALVRKVMVTLPPNIALYILNSKRSFVSSIEAKNKTKIEFKVDPSISAVDFHIELVTDSSEIESDVDDTNEEIAIASTEEKVIEQDFDDKRKAPQKQQRQNRSKKNALGKTKKSAEVPVKQDLSENQAEEVVEVKEEGTENQQSQKVFSISAPKTKKRNVRKGKVSSSKRVSDESANEVAKKSDDVSEQNIVSEKKAPRKKRVVPKNHKQSDDKIAIDMSPAKNSYSAKRKKMQEQPSVNEEINNTEEPKLSRSGQDQKNAEPVPNLVEGKIDYDPKVELTDYQKDIAEKVYDSYVNTKSAAKQEESPKKKVGWWTKLISK